MTRSFFKYSCQVFQFLSVKDPIFKKNLSFDPPRIFNNFLPRDLLKLPLITRKLMNASVFITDFCMTMPTIF